MKKRFAFLVLAGCALAPAAVLSGCKSSGSDPTTVGLADGVPVRMTPAVRQSQRSSATASSKLDPGHLRYLVRMAERREERGLPVPAEIRIAQRQERYQTTFSLLKSTRSLLDTITNPTTRYIPYLQDGPLAVTATFPPVEAQKPRASVGDRLTFKP
ncbi:MAG: hypothetical protein JXQ29_11865 [Planctomycetes bacterium]|nr:hypothetical protein [Planctomycetota bacterium]